MSKVKGIKSIAVRMKNPAAIFFGPEFPKIKNKPLTLRPYFFGSFYKK